MKFVPSAPILFLYVFLMTFVTVSAQDYVVTAKGDTLRGEVKPLSFGPNSTVRVTLSDKKKVSFTLFQVKAFYFKKETFQPVKGPNGYAFMKLQRAGYLSLFSFQLPNQMTYDGYYMTKMDGTGVEVPNLGFKKIITNFLEDCDTVVVKIDKGDLGKRNLIAIVDEYNECIKTKTTEHTNQIAKQEVQTKKISAWDTLDEKVKNQPDFEGKANALEMITDIKGKISRGEKVPNFLTDGLKNILDPSELKGDLENALNELK